MGRAENEKPRKRVAAFAGLADPAVSLLAQAEALDERAVRLDVAALEVVEKAAALAHHLEEPAARMEILDVRLEMFGEHVDPLGEERDLDLGRARVPVLSRVRGNDSRLVCSGYGHGILRMNLSLCLSSRLNWLF